MTVVSEALNCSSRDYSTVVPETTDCSSRDTYEKIYKEQERSSKEEGQGQSQNNEASLSQDNSLSMEDDFIGDKSDSDLIDPLINSSEFFDEIPLDREEMVTDTYDSMPSEPINQTYYFEDEPDLADDDDEPFSEPVGLNTPQQQFRELSSFANRVTAFNRKPNNHRY